MLRSAKSKFISEQVLKSSNCSKDLYKIVNNLTSFVPDNTMPHCDDDTELANKFADFFINKIKTIYDALENNIKFNPTANLDCSKFNNFRPMEPKEIAEIISSMKAKSCELDSTRQTKSRPVCWNNY